MRRFITYILLLLPLANTSCVREHWGTNDSCLDADGKSVLLKVSVPYIPQTRSHAVLENTIETLDILVFKVENGVETFQYWTNAEKRVGNVEGSSTQLFTVKLRVEKFQQRVVLIANARQEVMNLIAQVDWRQTHKETMLAQLTYTASNHSIIPMWGEGAPKIITAATTSISDTPIRMLRMVAKIEVQLDVDGYPALASTFTPKSVHLYNTNTSGRIVPKSGAAYIGTDIIVKKASLPASVTSMVGPLFYTQEEEIYLFETAAKNTGNYLQETCIVVGGLYGTDVQESYYRLDLFAPDNTTHLDILRNHHYIFNIVAVKERGHATVDEAYKAKSFQMKANILTWNQSEFPNGIIEGQYMLRVSHDRFEINGEAHDAAGTDNILHLITNVPTGWTASVWADKAGIIPVPFDVVTGAPWLRLSATSGIGGVQPNEIRLITEANVDGERTAYVHIKTGRLTYVVTVVQGVSLPGTITVTPDMMWMPYIVLPGGWYNVTVTCKKANGAPDPTANWTLTSADDSWLKLSLSPTASFSTASSSVSSNGNQTVYFYALDNLGMNSRRTTIYIGASPLETVVDVMQYGNPGSITENEGGGVPPKDVNTYVGAFWRNHEMGERIIRVEAGASSANYGTWKATVMWMDGRWGSDDGVMIDQNMIDINSLAARGISFSSKMNPDAFGTPENYSVSGFMASGTVTASDKFIMFRIGLKSTYTPSSDYPVRYAVVLLSYANETKHQKIFLRQGEEADHLFTNNDPVLSLPSQNGNLPARTVTRKFSPFNLTAQTLDATTDISGSVPEVNPGAFTSYPTQAGAFFQWANGYTGTQYRGIRTAFNPYTSTITGWVAQTAAGYWNTLAANHETCPPGYRRPTDGSITSDEKGASIANSEMRQSLLQKPRTGVNYTADASNSIKGYYADGFFDRRQLVTGPGLSGLSNTAVEADNRNIAYYGNLFFNTIAGSDRYNASLFFPIAGFREPSTSGQLYHAGNVGGYWAASAYDNVSAMFMRFIPAVNTSAIWADAKTNGYLVRCVKIP